MLLFTLLVIYIIIEFIVLYEMLLLISTTGFNFYQILKQNSNNDIRNDK